MNTSAADQARVLQRTRQELRSLIQDDEPVDEHQFPRSATMRLLVGGLGHRLVWTAAGGLLHKTGSLVGTVSKLVPVSAIAKLLWGKSRPARNSHR